MPCYFPLQAYRGRQENSQKIAITFKRSNSWRGQELKLPCGQCIGCKLERSRQWGVRCLHEASLYEENSFITLTYDDQNLPKDLSLHMEDFQKFMKRLRKSVDHKIRFFHCGEYGETTLRPHYHALLFGHDFSDKKYFSKKGEYSIYTSESLSSLWGKGHCVTGEVSFSSAAYVARYALKKITGPNADEHYAGRKPEYVTMSRRPGIGKAWYDKYKTDIFPRDYVVVRGNRSRVPRFYDNQLQLEDPSTMALLKIEREKNANGHYVDDWLSDGSHIRVSDSSLCRLAVKEEVKVAEIRNLKRGGVS